MTHSPQSRPSKSTLRAALSELANLLGNRSVTSDAMRAEYSNITMVWSSRNR